MTARISNEDIADALDGLETVGGSADRLVIRLAMERLRAGGTEGWFKWYGGEKPDLFDDTLVSVRFRDGHENHEETVGYWRDATGDLENNWVHNGSSLDIVAYRVVAK